MKKLIAFLLSVGTVLGSVNVVHAQKIAVKSDIRAYIDYTPIKSYNVDGYTYVIAEELRNYGFDVVWSNEDRSLRIVRKDFTTPVYTKELAEGDLDAQGSSYKIFDTDIKTYLNGDVVNSYNIGGRTVMQIDELTKCGSFKWNADDRRVDVGLFAVELQKLYEDAEGKTEIVYDGEPNNKYTGQVNADGLPHGIGCMETQSLCGSGGVSYANTEKILGYFNNGKPDENVFIERYTMAGKMGFSVSMIFIGTIDSQSSASREFILDQQEYKSLQIREPNMGKVVLPYRYASDLMDREIFPDTNVYSSGVWYENDGYRGQKGVTYSSWYDDSGYQSHLKTGIDKNGNPTSEFTVLSE